MALRPDRATLLLICGLCCLGFQRVAAQIVQPENLSTSREFLIAAYPQLLSTWRVAQFEVLSALTGPSRFNKVKMHVGDDDRELKQAELSTALLSADFSFDTTGRLESFWAEGRLMRPTDNLQMAHEVERHQEWSAADIAGA